MNRSKRLRAGAIYGAFLLLVTLVLDCAFGTVFLGAGNRSFRIAHSYYHHALLPNRSTTTKWGRQHYAMYTDSLGFRDEAPRTIERDAPGPRTVLLGDSMIEGLGLDFPKTAAGILAARGRERGVEVLNAAAVSYSPKLYDLKTRWLVEHEQLSFQRLVVFVDISDIQDETFYESFVPVDRSGWLATGVGWWTRHSLLWQAIDRYVLGHKGIDNQLNRDADIDVWMAGVDAYRNPTSNPEAGRWEWTYDDAAYARWGRRGLELAEANMSRLVEFCRQHGIEVVVAVYPSPFQIFANELDGKQVRAWRAFCEREGIPFVDLFPAFIDARPGGADRVYDRYFIPDDVHWNEAGNALVAERMEAAVLGPARP